MTYKRFEVRRAIGTGTLGCIVTIGGLTPALAQEEASGLAEITVSAQKRMENAQDVPISMSAFSGDQLQQLGVERTTDLVSQVPNVGFFSFFGEAQTPSLCFRSVCLNQQFSDSFEAPVAMYTDEVYVGSAFAQALQLFDIDRIEVLKGPQGTLYGRNTTGGLVNVVTRKPTDELDVRFGLEYGSHNSTIAEAAVGGPIAAGVRGRIAARIHKADAFVGGTDDRRESGDSDTTALRAMLDFDLGKDATLLLSGFYFRVDQDAVPSGIGGTLDPVTGQQCNLKQLTTGNCVGIFDTGLSANQLYGGYGPDKWLGADIPGGVKPRNYVKSYGGTATLKWKLGAVDLTSITGYSRGEKDYIEDLDGSIQFQFDDRLFADAKTFSQEVRLSGNVANGDWLVGAFYYDDKRNVGTTLFPVEFYEDSSEKKTDSRAIYANVDLPLPGHETVHAILGGRFTDESRDVVFSRSGDFTSPVTHTTRSVDSSNFDWKAALQWRPTDTTLIYGSVTTSFRSANMNNQFIFGGVNPASTLDSLKPVSPEHLRAHEIGFKSDFWNGRARLNAATFYYDIRDMQFLIFVFDPNVGLGASRLRNVEKANVWGAEMDLTVLPIDNLELRLSGGFVDSELKSKQQITVDDVNVPLDGRELPFSNPSASASARYTFPLADKGSLQLYAGYSWIDNHYFSINNTVTTESPAYGLVDLSVTWMSPSKRYSVQAYGDNVFDKDYYVYTGTVYPNTVNTVWGRPAWWGLKFNARF